MGEPVVEYGRAVGVKKRNETENKMKSIVLTCVGVTLSLCIGCSEPEPVVPRTVEDHATVALTLETDKVRDDSATGTRAISPMIPDAENLIRDIWVIQYDAQGVVRNLYTRHYRETATPTLRLESFPIDLAVLNDCTVCLVVNRNPGQTGLASPWENTFAGFCQQYLDLVYRTTAGDEGIPDVAGLPMFGYWQGDITATTTSLAVTVGRMLARVHLVVKNDTGVQIEDTRVMVENAIRRAYYYPRTENADLSASDRISFTDSIGSLDAGVTTYLYYYVAPNLTPASGEETRVRISATKNGVPVSSASISLGSMPDDPAIYRNYNYTITLSLK